MGDLVSVFDTTAEGWAWGQLTSDGYVGYLPLAALARGPMLSNATVIAPMTLMFSSPDIKSPPVGALPLGAVVPRNGEVRTFTETRSGTFIPAKHLAASPPPAGDFVSIAEQFIGAPYLWGGKTHHGIDCSGLVQVALAGVGVRAPRDSDMQREAVGEPLTENGPLRRGDLIFWDGHVGIMRDTDTLLHANAHHMMVASEPLAEAVGRIENNEFGAVIAVRRLNAAVLTRDDEGTTDSGRAQEVRLEPTPELPA